jgi:Holliday junction resolvase-like predicted endonuclease
MKKVRILSEFEQEFELELRFHLIKCPIRDIENFVKDYYRRKGFTVIRNNAKGENGKPDFLVKKGVDSFYVECKSAHDGLRLAQVKWILEHLNEKILIFCEDS